MLLLQQVKPQLQITKGSARQNRAGVFQQKIFKNERLVKDSNSVAVAPGWVANRKRQQSRRLGQIAPTICGKTTKRTFPLRLRRGSLLRTRIHLQLEFQTTFCIENLLKLSALKWDCNVHQQFSKLLYRALTPKPEVERLLKDRKNKQEYKQKS